MKALKFFYLSGILLLLGACSNNALEVEKKLFSGYAQKGPFINGSSVTISELDNELNQTGRSYNTIISDNSGNFEQRNIELISNFVQLRVDGYFFNEVIGKNSNGQINLYALADISNVNSANVNVLTHLEKGRIEYLVREKGVDFAKAKNQAQKEVLDIFGFKMSGNTTSESLDLTENGMLLAISCILEGYFPTANMMELMADIITDIKTDGIMNNQAVGSRLISNAKMLNLPEIRTNIEKKYAGMNMNVVIPDFETYVQKFIDESDFEVISYITYPESGMYGNNILADEVTEVNAWIKGATENTYSLKADLPEGTSLKIIIKDGLWSYMGLPAPINWNVDLYNLLEKSQTFTVINSGTSNDLRFYPESGDRETGYITIEYYENGANTPTKIKRVKVLNGKATINKNDSISI